MTRQTTSEKRFLPAALLSCGLFLLPSAHAAVTLADLAFIGLGDSGTPNNDEFSFVALNNIGVGEAIYWGDIGMNGNTVARTGDLFKLTVTAEITTGSVLTLDDTGTVWTLSIVGLGSGTVTAQETGVFSDSGSNANIGGTDPFMIFSSSDGAATAENSTPLFLVNTTAKPDGISKVTYAPTGLTDASGIVERDPEDVSSHRYTGPRTGTAAELFASISDDANWTGYTQTTNGQSNATGGGFTVIPVPEPSGAVFLSAAALLGLAIRRR